MFNYRTALKVAATFIAFGTTVVVTAQDDGATRVWKDKSGKFRLEATFESVTADKVKLRRKDDGRTIEVPLASLSEADVNFLRVRAPEAFKATATKIETAAALEAAAQRRRFAVDALAMYDQFLADPKIQSTEKLQAQKTRERWAVSAAATKIRAGTKWFTPAEYRDLVKDEQEILESAHDFSKLSDPAPVAKKLSQASTLNPSSITADFIFGIGHALFMDNKRRSAAAAEDRFAACIRRLTSYEQDLNDTERANLAACYNNRALACIRQRQYSEAIHCFEQCMNSASPADAVIHNLMQFQAIAADAKGSRDREGLSAIRLTLEERGRLDRLCNVVRDSASSTYVKSRGWRYMRLAEVDIESLLGATSKGTVGPADVSATDLVEAGGGTGFVVGAGLIATNRHVSDGGVAYSVRLDGEEKTAARKAQLVIASGDPKLDLALLKCESLKAPSVAFCSDDPKLSTEICTLGFPQFYQLGTGIKVSKGMITALPPHRGIAKREWESSLMHDAITAPGSSGGPVFDRNGLIVGVHTGVILNNFKIAMPGAECTKFLLPHVPGLQTKSLSQGTMTWENAVEAVRAATVHILVYRSADRFNAILQSTPEQTNTYDDRSCLACFGTNVLRCPNRQCEQGSVFISKEEIVPAPGNNTVRQVRRIRSECPTCDGRSQVQCEYCNSGVDPWFSR